MNAELNLSHRGGNFRWTWGDVVEWIVRWGWALVFAILSGHISLTMLSQHYQDVQIKILMDNQKKVIDNQKQMIDVLSCLATNSSCSKKMPTVPGTDEQK